MNRAVKNILRVACVVGALCLPVLVSHWESVRGRADAVVEVDSGTVIFSAGGGAGTIVIQTIGENTIDPTASAPYVDVWVDSFTAAVKTVTNAGLSVGSHTARSELRHGLTQSVGTCTYAEGGSPCTVSSFTDIPTNDCDLTRCNKAVSVTGGQVTKVVFKHRGVYEGWGASTIGGRDGAIITVTNTNASGSGSLREALDLACTNNNRYIRFADTLSGTITLPHTDNGGINNGLKVCGNQITVDGFTAADPGITIAQYGLNIHVLSRSGVSDPKDTRDIILRGFRLRKGGYSAANCNGTPPDDCEPQVINIETGASSYSGGNKVHDVVIDHLSISGGRDDLIGISRGSYNITLSYNYISAGAASNQGFLSDSLSEKMSYHHNRISRVARRNPQITYHNVQLGSTSTTVSANITADIRHNLHVAYKDGGGASHWGVLLAGGTKTNVVKNYFTADSTLAGDTFGPNNAIIVCNPSGNWLNADTMATCGFCSVGGVPQDSCRRVSDTFVDGNAYDATAYGDTQTVDMNNLDVNVGSAISSPSVTGEATALLSACAVHQKAGFRPLDSHDTTQATYYTDPCV